MAHLTGCLDLVRSECSASPGCFHRAKSVEGERPFATRTPGPCRRDPGVRVPWDHFRNRRRTPDPFLAVAVAGRHPWAISEQWLLCCVRSFGSRPPTASSPLVAVTTVKPREARILVKISQVSPGPFTTRESRESHGPTSMQPSPLSQSHKCCHSVANERGYSGGF